VEVEARRRGVPARRRAGRARARAIGRSILMRGCLGLITVVRKGETGVQGLGKTSQIIGPSWISDSPLVSRRVLSLTKSQSYSSVISLFSASPYAAG